MRKITFEELRKKNKDELLICIYKDRFECAINNCDFHKIEIDQYLKALEYNNLKLLIFKFYLPKRKSECIKIFYSEEESSEHFSTINKKWRYKSTSKSEEILIYEDTLATEYCEILNNENQDIRDNIKDFFIKLGCDIDKILLNEYVQKSLKSDIEIENEGARESAR